MQTPTPITFSFAGTSFEVVSSYGMEVFSIYQLSVARGREAHSMVTIDEARADVWSLAHAAIVAVDHDNQARYHARMVA